MSRNKGQRVRQYYDQQRNPSEGLFFYFFHIREKDHYPYEVERNWKKLRNPRNNFNAKQLANILRRTAGLIADYERQDSPLYNPVLARQLRNIVIENWVCWEEPTLKISDDLNPINIAFILEGHRALRLIPSPEMHKALSVQEDEKSSAFDPIDFSSTFLHSAYLGIGISTKLTSELFKRLERTSEYFGGVHKSDLLWALAVEDSVAPRCEYQSIARMLATKLPKHIRHTGVQKMRHDALEYFGIPHNFENPYRKETTSRMEVELFGAFKRAGVQVVKHDKCPINGFHQAIDWSIVTDGGREIHTEIDGPTHFNEVINPCAYQEMNPQPNGNTVFRNARLRQEGKGQTVLRIPYTISDLILNKRKSRLSSEQKEAVIKGLVRVTENATPDVYQATFGAPEGQFPLQLHTRVPSRLTA